MLSLSLIWCFDNCVWTPLFSPGLPNAGKKLVWGVQALSLGDGEGLREELLLVRRVVRPWSRLPREAVNAPSLEVSKPGWTGF